MTPADSLTRASLFLLASVPVLDAQAQTPTLGTGSIQARVTRAGQPVANATVCVGVSGDLNLYHQGTTDAQGRVSFQAIPPRPIVITANAGTSGTQQVFPATSVGVDV